jgi:hypothetical protein
VPAFHASGNASLVEILERPANSSSSRGSPLEDIFQIVIIIFVQSADGQDFKFQLNPGHPRRIDARKLAELLYLIVPGFQQRILARITDQHLRDVRPFYNGLIGS